MDANVVFQQNAEDDRNWVQGKNIDNKLQDPMANHLNKLPNIQVDEAAAMIPQGVKKRPLFRKQFSFQIKHYWFVCISYCRLEI